MHASIIHVYIHMSCYMEIHVRTLYIMFVYNLQGNNTCICLPLPIPTNVLMLIVGFGMGVADCEVGQ